MVWVLMGARECVLRPTRHSLVTLFPCLCRLRTSHYIGFQANHRLIIPSTYLGMDAWKTCCSLVMDSALSGPTVRVFFWVRRSLHRTESGTQGWGLESQFGRGPGDPGQEGDGLVLLVPWVQAGCVFSGYLAKDFDSQIADVPVRLILTLASQ